MKKHYTNTTNATVFVGGKMIAPGVTRLVDVMVATAAAAAPVISYAEMLANKVGDLPDLLLELNLEQLEEAKRMEESSANRKGAISAIEEAIENISINADLAEFAQSLSDAENLDELMLKFADNEAKSAMIEEEMAARKQRTDSE
jgi:hypothetical protein